MATTAKTSKKTKASKKAGKKSKKTNGDARVTVRFLDDIVQRGRGAQKEGLKKLETIKDRFDEMEFAQRVRDQIESSGEILTTNRDRIQTWTDNANSRFVEARERILHNFGFATVHDLEKMNRQIRAIRSRVKNLSTSVQ